jgi:CHASE2 domain-containing sensor protein
MRRFLLDTVLCSGFIFALIGLFASLTVFKIFDVLDPVGEMFEDFELTDLVMSSLREEPPADPDIVLVNIGDANREMIAALLDVIGQYEPAVMGVDVTFNEPKPYKEDSLFEAVLMKYPNIIIGSELRLYNEKTDKFDTLLVPEDRLAHHADWGFVNLVTDAENQDDVKFCREFVVRQSIEGRDSEELAFAVKLAEYKNPEITQKFLTRGNILETINYRGNGLNNGQSKFGARYSVLDYPDVFAENFVPELIKDHVIIFCYMGKYLGDNQTRTDIYFTPLNKHYVGRGEPDMFGGVVHANIVSMILNEDYVNTMSSGWGIFWAIFACLFNVFLFKLVYGVLPRWYDGITKLFQLFQVLVIMGLMIWMFDHFSYKADFTLMLVVIALSGDSIEVYHGVVKNLFSKRARKDLFKINRKFLTQV